MTDDKVRDAYSLAETTTAPSDEMLEAWGLTSEDWDHVVGDSGYLAARREADAKTRAMKGLVMERVAELNRILKPVGLHYDVRDVCAE